MREHQRQQIEQREHGFEIGGICEFRFPTAGADEPIGGGVQRARKLEQNALPQPIEFGFASITIVINLFIRHERLLRGGR
jgi:hypothetical protein